MSGNLVFVIGGALSCLAVGWAVGRSFKTIRQFFDSI